jgi:hypothetical protein
VGCIRYVSIYTNVSVGSSVLEHSRISYTYHPASYMMGSGGSFPGGKARPGRDTDHSPRSSAEVKKQ